MERSRPANDTNLHLNINENLPNDPQPSDVQLMEDDEQLYKPLSKRENHMFGRMTHSLNTRLRMDGGVRNTNEKQRKTLHALATTGRGTASNPGTLPSETTNLESLGALHLWLD